MRHPQQGLGRTGLGAAYREIDQIGERKVNQLLNFEKTMDTIHFYPFKPHDKTCEVVLPVGVKIDENHHELFGLVFINVFNCLEVNWKPKKSVEHIRIMRREFFMDHQC